ncbi:MAG TPA: MotA/TolQ/ExbB proton channel family protein [Kofleriaceae bacterium]|nr:MotA/TolQ/ExbB proton channel family protein [Kofleriaceae bacterium]
MSFDLVKIVDQMGVFALAILVVLVVMFLAGLTVLVERLWVYRRTRRRSIRFAGLAARLLERGDHDSLVTAAEDPRGGPLASLLAGGLRTYRKALATPPSGDVSAIELTRRELARRADYISAGLRRGLGVLASVGSIAPFVGLLGTVIGIIDAFEGIAAEGSGGIGAVSSGIAEALIVTAVGLGVAIPTVLAFNLLTARCDSLMMAIDQARGQLVDHLEAHPAPAGSVSASSSSSSSDVVTSASGRAVSDEVTASAA